MSAKNGAILLVVVILTGCTGFFGYQYFLSTSHTPEKPVDEAKEEPAGQEPSEDAPEEERTPGAQEFVLYPLRSFVVNLADRTKGRYLKITLALVVRKATETRLKVDTLALASIQDRMLTILTTKTVEELLTADGKLLLKQELILQLNSILGEGNVQDIFFADFIIQ